MLDSINNETNISDFVKGFTPKHFYMHLMHGILKNAWHRLLPYTLFIDDDGTGFNGVGLPRENSQILELMNYTKNRNINLEESDIIEVLECDKDALTINSDEEILNNALNMIGCSDEDEETTDSEQSFNREFNQLS